MDNLPNDPSNPNNGNNNNPPPPFGSDFHPHTNPIDPNNPLDKLTSSSYQTQPPQPPPIPDQPKDSSPHHRTRSDAAQQRQRDEQGHFLPYGHPANFTPQENQSSSILPHLVETNPRKDSKDEDPPLIKITNPVTYLKRWWNKILAKEGIDFKLGFKIKPITAVLIASIIISGGVSSGVTAIVLKTFWPTSSPVLHRQIIQQGIIQTGTEGFYLASYDQSIWKLKPKKPNVNLGDQVGKQVTVTGNLTKEANLIEVSEIILPLPREDTPTGTSWVGSSETGSSQTKTLPAQTFPNSPESSPGLSKEPALYSSLTWEVTQSKTLTFTSGKRRIEQEGVYLESSQVTQFPQDFVDYYTNQLTTLGFKQTFNSSDPNGTTTTYAKEDLFLTFGVKNIYKGSGNNKQTTGYKAYLEHN